MRLWAGVGLGAAAALGTAMAVRWLRPKSTPWEPTEDEGVLEVRGESGSAESAEREALVEPEASTQPWSRADGRALIERLGRQGNMTPAQIQFLVFVASKESRLRPNVGRGDPALRPPGLHRFLVDLDEADAARRAYARNARVFADCGHDPEAYSFGSAGLFGFLPTYPLYHFRRTPLRCAHPYEVFDPPFSMAAAYSFARGLSRHPAFDGTVVELRAGWGALARMKNPESYAHKIPEWRAQLRELGIEESWLFEAAPTWPKRDLMALYHAMGGRLARAEVA